MSLLDFKKGPPRILPPRAREPREVRHTHRVEVSPGLWWVLVLIGLLVILVTEGRYRH